MHFGRNQTHCIWSIAHTMSLWTKLCCCCCCCQSTRMAHKIKGNNHHSDLICDVSESVLFQLLFISSVGSERITVNEGNTLAERSPMSLVRCGDPCNHHCHQAVLSQRLLSLSEQLCTLLHHTASSHHTDYHPHHHTTLPRHTATSNCLDPSSCVTHGGSVDVVAWWDTRRGVTVCTWM